MRLIRRKGKQIGDLLALRVDHTQNLSAFHAETATGLGGAIRCAECSDRSAADPGLGGMA
jgi:predicted outer membrane repeat protein